MRPGISRIEGGHQNLTVDTLCKLANALDTTVLALLGGSSGSLAGGRGVGRRRHGPTDGSLRLKIDRFRNVMPGTVLEFGPTFNVLLGKNATGKSTLLDLVAAVTNDDLSAYAG